MLWLCLRLPLLAHEASAHAAPTAGAAAAAASAPALQAAIERLAAWAYQWSSQVSYRLEQPPLLWLEVGASAALFGGHTALLERIENELQQLGYSHCCALAPTPAAAALLTQAPAPRCVYTRAQLRTRLTALPLTLLALPPQVIAGLQASGLRHIGEVLRLPPAALARRFEPTVTLYLRRLLGSAPEPLPDWQLPPHYRARFEFDSEVRATTALLFPLRRLLLEFQGYLRGRDVAVLHFTLRLEHYRRESSCIRIGLSAPSRDAAQLLQLAHERLQAQTLPAAVSALSLEALAFTAPSIVQTDLFGSQAQQLQQLQLLLDRLHARLGEEAIHGIACADDHRPERAWQFGAPTAQPAQMVAPRAARPCALLREPRRIETPTQLLSGPERIQSGWWDGADATRDYYIACGTEGARQWVYRDLRDGSWYLQGLWT